MESVEINGYHSLGYGKEWKKGGPQETNLNAILRRPGSPANLRLGLILLYENGTVQGADGFLKRVGEFERLFQSTKWLVDFIQSKPDVFAELSFVHDTSLSPKALAIFTADMNAAGKKSLAAEVGGCPKFCVSVFRETIRRTHGKTRRAAI